MSKQRKGIDSPVFAGRLRNTHTPRRTMYQRRGGVDSYSRLITDIKPSPSTDAPNADSKLSQLKPATRQPQVSKQVISDVLRHPIRESQSAARLHPIGMQSRVLRREGVTPVRLVGKKPHARRFTQQKAITGIAALLVIAGLWIGLTGIRANKEVAATSQRLSEESSGNDSANSDVPSEGTRPDVGSYKVAATLPRIIRIPKYHIEARVMRVGVKADNQLIAPANIFDAGWYEASSKPGEAGAMLIDGHVSGPTKHGVFYDLKKLVPGDLIEVERGDGKSFTYKVIRGKSYPVDEVDMAAALVPVTPGNPGLNLMTCDGALDVSRNHYQNRIVVFTEQL